MIALIKLIINLVLETLDINQMLVFLKDFIRIIEVLSIIPQIISYINCNKVNRNTFYLITIFIILFYLKKVGLSDWLKTNTVVQQMFYSF